VAGLTADPSLAAGVQHELPNGAVVLAAGAHPGAPAQPAARQHTGETPLLQGEACPCPPFRLVVEPRLLQSMRGPAAILLRSGW
jgi:hypothetical protein